MATPEQVNHQLRATVQQLMDDKTKLAGGLKQKIAALIQQKKDFEMSAMRAEQRGQQLQLQLQQRGAANSAPSGPPAAGPEADMLRSRIGQMENDRQLTHAKIKMKLQQIVADKHQLSLRVRELEQTQVDPMAMYEMRKTVAILFNEKQTLTAKYSEQNVALQNARMWLAQNNQLRAQLQRMQAERGEAVQVIEKIKQKAAEIDKDKAIQAQKLEGLRQKNAVLAERFVEEKGSLSNASLWEQQNELLRYQIQKLENDTKMLNARVKDATMSDTERAKHAGAEKTELLRQAKANEEAIRMYKENIEMINAETEDMAANKPFIEADIANSIAEKAGLTMRVRGLSRLNLEKGEAKMRQELLDIEEEMNSAILENERLGADLLKIMEWDNLNEELRAAVANMLDDNARTYEQVQMLTNPEAFQDDDADIAEILGNGSRKKQRNTKIPSVWDRFAHVGSIQIVQEEKAETIYAEMQERHVKLTSGNTLKELLETQRLEAEVELERRAQINEDGDGEGEDGTDNSSITFVVPKAGQPASKYPQIKCATFEKLVERLTFEKYPDMEYVSHFMLTYRSICQPIDLMEAVILRYCITPPPELEGAELKNFKVKTQTPIRLRVFNIMKSWITDYYYDFDADDRLAETLTYFCNDVMPPTGMGKPALQLKKTLEKAQNEARERAQQPLGFQLPPPPSDKQKVKNLDRADIVKLAKAITHMESEMYHVISPKECFGLAWSKKKKNELSPNILAFVRRFNEMSTWVQHEVLSVPAGKHNDRSKVLKRFIQLARELVELKNFNGGMSIIAGLEAAAIYRLKNAWGRLDKKVAAEFEALKQILSSHQNYKQLRAHLHMADPPCIPYLGMYLTDMTFIADGNKDKVQGLLNFMKQRYYANVLREITQYQQMSYSLEVDNAYIHFVVDHIELSKAKITSEQTAYEISLSVEPRGSN